ncbi:hypothetical protein DW672_12740 [[Ruminococcus] lactaris]|uniref:Uncharacterized protein n=1 Tax=[Ruminococcus] lactaris TaxID=46228 RepID=A0A414P134_9FIRM|nr:hypothetical protein [[Ruminococcus] lactaris]RHF56552.1 hypothetical protein DW672_12740 [[Ruminococcus] lactaris]
MENKKEMTIPNVSAATDAEQSLSKCTDNSIVNQDTDFKGYEQSFEEMQERCEMLNLTVAGYEYLDNFYHFPN